jgi:hypothetical protein
VIARAKQVLGVYLQLPAFVKYPAGRPDLYVHRDDLAGFQLLFLAVGLKDGRALPRASAGMTTNKASRKCTRSDSRPALAQFRRSVTLQSPLD